MWATCPTRQVSEELANPDSLPNNPTVHIVDLLLPQTRVGVAVTAIIRGSDSRPDRGSPENAQPDCWTPADATPVTAPIRVPWPHNGASPDDPGSISAAAPPSGLSIGLLRYECCEQQRSSCNKHRDLHGRHLMRPPPIAH